MPAYGRPRTFAFSLFNPPFTLRYCSFLADLPKHHGQPHKTHTPNLTYNETQLLRCLRDRNFSQARQLLDKMPQRGSSQRQVVAWTSVLSKFSKRGLVDGACALFEIMPERNVVTYNAMLSGYIGNGRLDDACRLFDEMPERNVVSWTSMLFGLMSGGMVEAGKRLFEVMPERNLVTWNSMVVGLIRNRDLDGARRVFDRMPVKDLVSWNAMIDGYAENYRMEEARALFDRMEDKNVVTWTSLVAGYCKVGDVGSASDVFKRMPEKNVVSWTAMIGGLAWNGYYKEAILMFLEMTSNDAKPNKETFVSLAYACAGYGSPHLGMQLHAHTIVNYLEDHDLDGRLSNGLIYMYSKHGKMDYADAIFFKHSRNWTVQSCNAMINGYVQIGQLEKAQYVFNTVPFHDKISWTSMICGYFNAGQVWKACELFSKSPDIKDAIAWTVMISGHTQNELFQEANSLFSDMRAQGIVPLESTYSTLLRAAGAMADLDKGRQLHCLSTKTQSALDLILQNALISMYAKCGQLDDAYHIFSAMVHRDLISWNSMIIGFSLHGLDHQALELFEAMKRSEMKPNSVTFLGILSACNHSGLVDYAREVYRAMTEVYGIQPDVQHHVCMINLLGRAGEVKEAEEFVLSLPTEPGIAVLGALLGMCALSEENAEIANRAASRLIELDPLNAPGYIVLCNMRASNGEHEAEGMLRKEMRLKGVRKVPGRSWV